MAGLNSILFQSYDNSYLFENWNTSNKKSLGGNTLGIDLAEYASVSNGTYSKLIKAYYEKFGKDGKVDSRDNTDKETVATKSGIQSSTQELGKAAGVLTATGKNSIFRMEEQKNEETGVTTKGYSVDKIYNAVKDFVGAYNQVVKASVKSEDQAVLRQSVSMIQSTASNANLLGRIGVKIGADNTLSIDEETFKKGDMTVVKSLFNGNDSFGASIQRNAGNMNLRVKDSMGASWTYTDAGTYGKYTSGNILNDLL